MPSDQVFLASLVRIRREPPVAIRLWCTRPSPPKTPTTPPGPWLRAMSTQGFTRGLPSGLPHSQDLLPIM